MIGIVSEYSDTSIINYCPACGEEVKEAYADGTSKCEVCGMRFGVVEVCEESEVE